MKICTQSLSSRVYTFEVHETDTIFSFKKQILKEIGVANARILLVYSGKILENDHTIEESGLPDGAVTHLLLRRQPFQVFVKTMEGKSISLQVPMSGTVQFVKERMQEQEGIQTGELQLMYGGSVLADDCYLADCDIQDKCTLELALPSSE